MGLRRSKMKIACVCIVLAIVTAGCGAYRPGGAPAQLPAEQRGTMPTLLNSFAQTEPAVPPAVTELPPLVIPSPYQVVSPFEGAPPVSMKVFDAPLQMILTTITEDAGFNVVYHRGVPQEAPISVSLEEVDLEEALDIIMELSGCYYKLNGHTIHVHHYETRSFTIPYLKTRTGSTSQLGGDVLGGSGAEAGSQGTQYKGEFSLTYNNPEEMNDFYLHIQNNIQSLLSDTEEGRFVMNRFSGVVTVTDKRENVNRIAKMIEQVLEHSMKQVLIEAQIFEVILNDSHALGIDWEHIFTIGGGTTSIKQLTSTDIFGALGGSVATGVVQYTRNNFVGMLQLMRNAGDIETLSNPRIRVMNSQTALISSGKITPFWSKEISYDGEGDARVTLETFTRRDVLAGLSMGVTPVISQDGTILLNIIPVATNFERVDEQYDAQNNLIVSAPVINMKEAGTIIRVRDNDMVVIGGLISTNTRKEAQEVSGLASLPLLGHLFRGTRDVQERRELVIFLRIRSVEL
ncbi:hypothetical protein [Chrysiogenes arsenatis]|uniref:hypothetical protein n=1 Tax=Chrysiogenes arsenatis TaxID=309797 RepID=UPI0004162508|nr:hypothetical protein [Chrysiogenes arsenatis]